LKRYFGIDKLITRESAKEIWNQCNELLQSEDFTPRGLIKKSKVQVVVTTDDPTSKLEYHKKLASEEKNFKVLPGLRPDFLIEITNGQFEQYLSKLSQVVNKEIDSF